MNRKRPLAAVLIPFLVIFHVEFWALFPTIVGAFLVGTALSFAVIWWIAEGGCFSRDVGIRVAWLVIACWVLFSHLLVASEVRLQVLVLFAVVVLVVTCVESDAWLMPSLVLLALFGTVHACATILMYLVPDIFTHFVKPTFFPDTYGAVGYTSALTTHFSYNGTYIAVSFVAVFCFLIYGGYRGRMRLLVASAFLANGFALFLTSKRAHILFAVLALLIIYSLSSRRWKLLRVTFWTAALSVIVAIGINLVPGLTASWERITGSLQAYDLNELTTGRVILWEEALAGGQSSPVFGQGWGTFRHVWPTGNVAVHAHNGLLNIFYGAGYPGVIVFVAIICVTFRKVYSSALSISRIDRADAQSRVLTSAAVGFQVFFLAYGATSGEIFDQSLTYLPYFLSLGIALALPTDPGKNPGKNSTGADARLRGLRPAPSRQRAGPVHGLGRVAPAVLGPPSRRGLSGALGVRGRALDWGNGLG